MPNREVFTSNEKLPPIKRTKEDAIGKTAIATPQAMRRWLGDNPGMIRDMNNIRKIKIEEYSEIIDAYFATHEHLAYGFWLYPEELDVLDE